MDDAEFYRGSRFEILNKTIAMIHASPAYQRYIAQKRRRQFLNSFNQGFRYASRRPHLSEKQPKQRFCIRCEEPLQRRADNGQCVRCRVVSVRELSRRGLTLREIAARQRITVQYAHRLFLERNLNSALGRYAR